MAVQLAVGGEQLVPQAGVLADEVVEDLADRLPLGGDGRLPPAEGRRMVGRRTSTVTAAPRLGGRRTGLQTKRNATSPVVIVGRPAPLRPPRPGSASSARSGRCRGARPARSASPGRAPGRCRSATDRLGVGVGVVDADQLAPGRLGVPVGAQQVAGLDGVDPGGARPRCRSGTALSPWRPCHSSGRPPSSPQASRG